MAKIWVLSGALLAALGVMIGAFGAHGLREKLSERSMEIYQIGSHYQFIHSLGLILLGLWCLSHESSAANVAGGLFIAGIILFSGSLYALAITDIKILGAITPIGGLSFIAGWICFAISAWKAL